MVYWGDERMYPSRAKLYRVEVERTESMVVYVEAASHEESEGLALELAKESKAVDWVHDLTSTSCERVKAPVSGEEWAVVDNDPTFRSVGEWFDGPLPEQIVRSRR